MFNHSLTYLCGWSEQPVPKSAKVFTLGRNHAVVSHPAVMLRYLSQPWIIATRGSDSLAMFSTQCPSLASAMISCLEYKRYRFLVLGIKNTFLQ